MSREFKLRFDQMRESNPAKSGTEPEPAGDGSYHYSTHAQNLCLVWPDGRRYFLNYAYLVAGELTLNENTNVIRLSFSSYQVIIAGFGLEALFMELLDHLPRIITAVNPRYVIEDSLEESIVTDIQVIQGE